MSVTDSSSGAIESRAWRGIFPDGRWGNALGIAPLARSLKLNSKPTPEAANANS